MRNSHLFRNLVSACVMLGLTSPALASKEDDTLNIVWETSVATLDFYFMNVNEGHTIAMNVCDALVYRDPSTRELVPLLAEKWSNDTPKRIEMSIRQGVKFHDGTALTADDVVFTLNHFSKPATGAVSQYLVDWIDHVEKVGDNDIVIHTKNANKAVLDQLSNLNIYPQKYYEKVGSQGFSVAPICTGPYKVESVTPGSEMILVKNDDYFEGGPKTKPSIGRVSIRSIQDANTRLAELMTGNADWLYRLSQDQADKLAQVPGINVTATEGIRVFYIMFNPVNPPADSPIKNPKVRQAMAHAIDRQSLVTNLARGKSKVLNTFCHPLQTGCIDDVFKYDYDVQKAKALLAEAGYPNGFSIDLFAYRDRPVTEALIGDLQKVGINASIKYMQYKSLDQNWIDGKLPMAHQSWGGLLMDAGNNLSSHFLAPDSITTDEAIKENIRKGLEAATEKEQHDYYMAVLTALSEGAYWVPLYTASDNAAFSDTVDFTPQYDEKGRYYDAKWK